MAADFRSCTAVLMAGGRSLRFGSDKAFHEVSTEAGTRPLWVIQLEKLRQATPGCLIISANAGQQFTGVPEDVRLILDAWPDRGPLGGLASCLAATSDPHMLVLAVDMVDMTGHYLRGLVEKAELGRGTAPVREGRWEPLAAVFPVEILPLMEERLRADDLSLQGLLTEAERLGLMTRTEVKEDEAGCFLNLNRPG